MDELDGIITIEERVDFLEQGGNGGESAMTFSAQAQKDSFLSGSTLTDAVKTPSRDTIGNQTEISPRKVKSFKTAKGSLYLYDHDGKTTRFKTATGEQQTKQDLTVFADLTPDEEQAFDRAYLHVRDEDKDSKVYVIERQQDSNTPRLVRDVTDVQNPDMVYLAIKKGDTWPLIKKASLTPVIGGNAFDTRHWEENGEAYTERHLGNKVVDIQFEDN